MPRRNYNKISEPLKKEISEKIPFSVKEKGQSVRIRSGPGVSYAHVDGKYLGSGVFEIDEISDGPGSESGWGKLSNGSGWVGLDFVDRVYN